MKKLIFIITALTIALLAAIPSSAGYFTFDSEEESEEEKDYYAPFADAIPEDLRDPLEGIFTPDEESGAIPDPWTRVADIALDYIGESIVPAFARLSVICGVVILSALWRSMGDTVTAGQGFHLLVRSVLALSVLETQTKMLTSLTEFSSRLCNTVSGFIPAMAALYIASGNVTSSVLTQSGMALLITLAQNLLAFLILPAVKASYALSAVSCVTGQNAPGAVGTFLRNSAALICTAAMTVLTFIFSLRLKVGEAADSAMMKTVQFAVGSFVPIVGGAVSDSVSHVGASISFIKASCGSVAVAVIVILLLPTLISLLLNRAVLFISKHLCAALSLPEEEKLLGELGSGASLTVAFAASCAVMFIICMALFVRSAVAAA